MGNLTTAPHVIGGKNMNLEVQDLTPFVLLVGALILGGIIGYVLTDGIPDTINLTESETNSIKATEKYNCNIQVRALNKEIDECKEAQTRAFELVSSNYDYYDSFVKELNELEEEVVQYNTDTNELISTQTKDLNELISDLNK